MTATATYTAKDITVLEGLEPVRKRPSMYIGGVDGKGLHHLVWEIIDNAVDEYLNNYADTISVTLHKGGDAITISDNGRGIPVDNHLKYKKPALELLLTTLHSGAKFGEGGNYLHSGGLHGVGSSVVNALSKKLIATIRRDGHEWQQTFKRGSASCRRRSSWSIGIRWKRTARKVRGRTDGRGCCLTSRKRTSGSNPSKMRSLIEGRDLFGVAGR